MDYIISNSTSAGHHHLHHYTNSVNNSYHPDMYFNNATNSQYQTLSKLPATSHEFYSNS